MRIELRDGQWADLRERISHAQDKTIQKAWARGKADPLDDRYEFGTTVVRVFVRAWHVLDPDGQAIPLDDADAIDRAPEDIVDDLYSKGMELWTEATVPNSPTPPSSDVSPSEA